MGTDEQDRRGRKGVKLSVCVSEYNGESKRDGDRDRSNIINNKNKKKRKKYRQLWCACSSPRLLLSL